MQFAHKKLPYISELLRAGFTQEIAQVVLQFQNFAATGVSTVGIQGRGGSFVFGDKILM